MLKPTTIAACEKAIDSKKNTDLKKALKCLDKEKDLLPESFQNKIGHSRIQLVLFAYRLYQGISQTFPVLTPENNTDLANWLLDNWVVADTVFLWETLINYYSYDAPLDALKNCRNGVAFFLAVGASISWSEVVFNDRYFTAVPAIGFSANYDRLEEVGKTFFMQQDIMRSHKELIKLEKDLETSKS